MDIYQQLEFNRKNKVPLKTNILPQELIAELNISKEKFLEITQISERSLGVINKFFKIKCVRKDNKKTYKFNNSESEELSYNSLTTNVVEKQVE